MLTIAYIVLAAVQGKEIIDGFFLEGFKKSS